MFVIEEEFTTLLLRGWFISLLMMFSPAHMHFKVPHYCRLCTTEFM